MSDELYNVVIREWLNGGLLPLNLCLCFVIARFLRDAWQLVGWGMTREPGVRGACALFWIFAADAARAGFVWIILRTQNRHLSAAAIEQISNIGFMIAAAVGLLAILRSIYIFTPKAWGHRGWIFSACITAAFLALSHFV